MYKTLLASASCLAILAQAAHAQDVIELGDIIISAGETPIEADRTGVSVDVLDETDIEDAPDTRVVDTLGTVPGVAIATQGGPGTVAAVSVRGLPSRYVGFRLNGIDITDPSATQVQASIGNLTSAGLGRIEVLKGAQSAIYGSEAIGGLIDIRSARLTEDGREFRFGAEFGSFNTRRSDLSYLQKSGNLDLSFTLSRLQTDGYSAADENDGNTEADGFDGITGLFSLAYTISPTWQAGLDLFYQNDSFNIDAFGGAGGDADRPNTEDRFGGRVFAIYDTGTSYHEVAFSQFQIERRDPLGFSPFFEADRNEAKYDGRITLGAGTLIFGADYVEETARLSNGTFSTDNTAVFGEFQYAASAALDLSAAIRLDDHEQFGSATTGRLAAAWRPGAQTVVRASLGTGFRAPSLFELFGPFGANPDLQPEKSRSLDLGLAHGFANGAEIEATVFYNEIDNLITFVSAYEQSPGTTRTRGIELSGRVGLTDGLDLFGAYTYTDARNSDGSQTLRVPYHDLSVGIEGDLGAGLSGQLVVNHIAGLADDGFPSQSMQDFTVANLQVTYAATDNVDLYVRVENLFDEEYQRVAGYGTSDRAVYAGFRATY